MPFSPPAWPSRPFCSALAAAVLTLATQTVAFATAPERVVSINMCADQLLLAFADRDQIAGLSPWVDYAPMSFLAGKADGLPKLGATAEEVMKARADLVVGGQFTRRQTRRLLKRHGYPIMEIRPVRSLDDAKLQAVEIAEALGHKDRGEALVRGIDAEVAKLRQTVGKSGLSALYLQRRGYVAGSKSLMTSLLQEAGLENAAQRMGLSRGGRVPLEAVIRSDADLLVVGTAGARAEDQGSGMLRHPALDRRFPADRRIVVPESLTVCGGPGLIDAIRHIGSEVQRVLDHRK